MTPQPHCDHECVCMGYCNCYAALVDEPCPKPDCDHDTRSRTAPSPAPIRSMREDEDGYISWQQMNERALEEHDAAIAAQAREKVLKEIIEHLQSKRGEVMRMATDAYPIGVLDGTVLYLESLRIGGEPR